MKEEKRGGAVIGKKYWFYELNFSDIYLPHIFLVRDKKITHLQVYNWFFRPPYIHGTIHMVQYNTRIQVDLHMLPHPSCTHGYHFGTRRHL